MPEESPDIDDWRHVFRWLNRSQALPKSLQNYFTWCLYSNHGNLCSRVWYSVGSVGVFVAIVVASERVSSRRAYYDKRLARSISTNELRGNNDESRGNVAERNARETIDRETLWSSSGAYYQFRYHALLDGNISKGKRKKKGKRKNNHSRARTRRRCAELIAPIMRIII